MTERKKSAKLLKISTGILRELQNRDCMNAILLVQKIATPRLLFTSRSEKDLKATDTESNLPDILMVYGSEQSILSGKAETGEKDVHTGRRSEIK